MQTEISNLPLIRPVLVASLLAVAVAGCSRRAEDRPSTYQVTGKVTYQNQPVADARVEFMGTGMPRAATGTTNAAGEYTLWTFEPGDGAVAGRHLVSVVKQNPGAATVSELEGASYEQAMQQIASQSTKKAEPQNGGLPAKYASRETSGLEFTVSADGPNVYDIELKD